MAPNRCLIDLKYMNVFLCNYITTKILQRRNDEKNDTEKLLLTQKKTLTPKQMVTYRESFCSNFVFTQNLQIS